MRVFVRIIFVVLAILILDTIFLNKETVSSPFLPHPSLVLTAHWWEIPFQPPEKWFTPRWEDDQWYQERHKKQYRK